MAPRRTERIPGANTRQLIGLRDRLAVVHGAGLALTLALSGLVAIVAVAVPGVVPPERRILLAVAWLSVALVAGLSALVGWRVAGTLARRLGGALDQQELFLGVAAHELRTPIGRARAVAESARLIVATDVPKDVGAEVVGELDRLVTITEDASLCIDDLLLAGRIDAARFVHRFAEVRLDELVGPLEDVVPNLVVVTPGPVSVHGDAVLLRHLVQNLLGNARRHAVGSGSGGGDVRPGAVSVELASTTGPGGAPVAILAVLDEGPGFAPDVLDRAFERFVTGGRGTGLGLWIVRWIVELHGGSVAAANRPGGGAAVTVTLPASAVPEVIDLRGPCPAPATWEHMDRIA